MVTFSRKGGEKEFLGKGKRFSSPGSEVARDLNSLDLYLRELNEFPPLSRAEEDKVIRKMKRGDSRAHEKLICSNLRFVVAVAKEYQGLGLTLQDLIEEGNVGLLRAAQKFDETRGVKFISYAVWWIRQGILQALAEQGRIFRLPLNRNNLLNKFIKESHEMSSKLGREPTMHDMADRLNVELSEIDDLWRFYNRPISLDAPLEPDTKAKFHDHIKDEENPDMDEMIFNNETRNLIEDAFSVLDTRDAKILRLYFGLEDGEPRTLSEIGTKLGVSRERIRQIKERAIDKLRQSPRRKVLENLLN